MEPNIISIVGKSDSGKTTLLEKLIPELKKRGYRLGIVKHAHHGFQMDKKGKDSWRHRKAGADAALIVSPGIIALVKDEELNSFEELKKYLSDMDLIITEGFKKEKMPKIEIFRKAGRHREPLCMHDYTLAAFVTDSDYTPDAPIFKLDEIEKLADFIETAFIKKP
ncbi:MAG: molybdopterin-guanine dinucleotide biosynthesis protein B [Thermodesulfobacteriota bacterium]|nr:molybdopterin-guanine dinucleotide biosynthesis protein B [Thermodesulfobacteriota bacterium]